MVAKIASEENKPDGQYLVTPEQVSAYLAQLDSKRIPGIDRKVYKIALRWLIFR